MSGATTTGPAPRRVAELAPLLAGVGLLMAASALQFSLVGVRGADAFGDLAIGFISSAYFAGYLVGAWLSGPWIVRLGHIRTFSALASLASVVILAQALLVDPVTWAVARAVAGLCIAGMVVSVESWLNAIATNVNRGRVLGAYMVVMLGAFSAGQISLGLADPQGFSLFAGASILLSLSLVPVLLAVHASPEVLGASPVSVGALFRRAPIGTIGSFTGGVTWGVVAALFVVYAVRLGVPPSRATWFAASPMVGALLAQWPLGWLSDVVDRRVVIAAVSATGAATCAVAAVVASPGQLPLLLALGLVVGATTIPLYSLSIAHCADAVGPTEIVPASVTLQLASSTGSILGPLLVAVGFRTLGDWGLWLVVGGVSAACAAFAATRILVRPAPRPIHPMVHFSPRSTSVGALMVAEELGTAPPPGEAPPDR